jgi:hypothetical protein
MVPSVCVQVGSLPSVDYMPILDVHGRAVVVALAIFAGIPLIVPHRKFGNGHDFRLVRGFRDGGSCRGLAAIR